MPLLGVQSLNQNILEVGQRTNAIITDITNSIENTKNHLLVDIL